MEFLKWVKVIRSYVPKNQRFGACYFCSVCLFVSYLSTTLNLVTSLEFDELKCQDQCNITNKGQIHSSRSNLPQ